MARPLLVVTVCAVVLAASGGCSTDMLLGPSAEQGIDGLALLGPLCPVQQEIDPCPDAPYRTTITIRSIAGRTVATVRSGSDGRFRVGLAAGRYMIVPEAGDPFPTASAQQVDVVEGSYFALTIHYDTGIR